MMTHRRLRLTALFLTLDAYLGSQLLIWEWNALFVPLYQAIAQLCRMVMQ